MKQFAIFNSNFEKRRRVADKFVPVENMKKQIFFYPFVNSSRKLVIIKEKIENGYSQIYLEEISSMS